LFEVGRCFVLLQQCFMEIRSSSIMGEKYIEKADGTPSS